MENNNKEAFQLLSVNGSESSLSGPEIPEYVVAPKKKLSKRRSRAIPTSNRVIQPKPPCICTSRTVTVALAAVVSLVCWLCTLSWLAFVLHAELARLDGNVQKVVAGSQSVPDDLQRMHSVSRELQRNQTLLSASLATLTAQIANMSLVVGKVQNELGEVRQRINNAPELVSLPQQVKDLSKSVANWGSRIQDLVSTVDTLKQQETTLLQNVSSLEQRVVELRKQPPTPPPVAPADAAALKALKDAVEQVTTNLSSVNVSLSTDLNYLQEAFNKDHAKLLKIEDGAQNASARIKTLEVQCARLETVDALNHTVENLAMRLFSTGAQLQEVREAVTVLSRPKATDTPSLMSSAPTSGVPASGPAGPAPGSAPGSGSVGPVPVNTVWSSPRPTTTQATGPSEPLSASSAGR